jgi:hypothetical protein
MQNRFIVIDPAPAAAGAYTKTSVLQLLTRRCRADVGALRRELLIRPPLV